MVATLAAWAAPRGVLVAGGEVKVVLCGKPPKNTPGLPAAAGPAADSLQSVEFCMGCPDPHLEGSKVQALRAVHGPGEFYVTGTLHYAVPNTMEGNRLINKRELAGRVVVVDRGVVPLVDKVLLAQKAGAVGVVIADDGNCKAEFECGRVGSARMGGFSGRDPWQSWRDVEIPAVLVMPEVADRLRRMMDIQRMKIPGIGEQWVQAG